MNPRFSKDFNDPIKFIRLRITNVHPQITPITQITDLVKALIVAWYGQLYFQVVSASPWLNWTIEMLTI